MKRIIDKGAVPLEKVQSSDFIPFMSGRPKRESIIGKDDILNLRIALNSGLTWTEFLAHV